MTYAKSAAPAYLTCVLCRTTLPASRLEIGVTGYVCLNGAACRRQLVEYTEERAALARTMSGVRRSTNGVKNGKHH